MIVKPVMFYFYIFHNIHYFYLRILYRLELLANDPNEADLVIIKTTFQCISLKVFDKISEIK
jgi:hypothetical protein